MRPEKRHSETYRADVDGLRAVAVFLVIAYHFDLFSVSGGFVGVDVFFVISGYVITRSLLAAKARGESFSYVDFVSRRLLRLGPPAIIVVLTTLCIGWFLSTPEEYRSLGRSSAASLFFVANIYFSRQTGYFAPGSETQPLLHMWSLGVEEQFYLVAPVLIVTIAAWPRLRLLAWGAVLVGSFTAACLAAADGNADGYFLLQYRAFEIGIGVLIAASAVQMRSQLGSTLLGLAGVALIAASAIAIDSLTAFPGPWALVPCIGAALVIISGSYQTSLVTRVLSAPLLVFFGTLSYALYLWHWPLLTFAKVSLNRELTTFDKASLLISVFALAVATRFLIERPLVATQGRSPARKRAAVVAGFGVLGALLAGKVGVDGMRVRLNAAALAQDAHNRDLRAATSTCSLGYDASCSIGAKDEAVGFLVWGDSHALSLSSAFDAIGKAQAKRGILLAEGGCPPLINSLTDTSNPRPTSRCANSNARLLQTLESYPTIKHVLLHARWTSYTEIDNRRRVSQLQKRNVVRSRLALAGSLDSTVGYLTSRGLTVSVIGPVPNLARSPGVLQVRALLQSDQLPDHTVLSLPIEEHLKATSHITDALDAVATRFRVAVLHPQSVLCSELFCRAIEGNSPLYYDDHHLNAAGAQQLITLLSRAFEGK